MKSKNDFKYEDDYKEYLRHYYAGLAMQGFMANRMVAESNMTSEEINNISECSVLQSDSLIKHLNSF